MKQHLRISFRLFCLSLLSTALLRAQTPLAANGRLQVINRQLCNEAGAPIQLRGMSSHGLHWFPSCFTQSSVQALATDWGSDVFRAAMYVDEGGYVNDPAGLRAKINQIVDWTAAAGVYCVIDWHILNPGDPNLHLAEAKDFFRTMAQTHAGKKHVIYELCNEPNGVSWAQIKSYAEAIIPEIRQYDPTAVLLVGTPNYSGTPGDVRGNAISGSLATNLMYTFHFYAGSHFSQDYIKEVLQTVPLFISEWGTSNYSGNGGDNYTNAQAWVDLMAGNNPSGIKVSWCNWNFSDKNESSAALQPGACGSGSWNNTSPSGTWVKQRQLSPADSWAGTPPPPQFTPLPARTIVGYWENWNDGKFIPLRDVPTKYNAVNVSFLETANGDGYTATFTPTAPYTEATFKADVQTLKQRGTPVLISIGGQNGVVKLNTVAQKNTFVQTVRQIIDRYGFDGIDLDLEGSSMSYGGNNPDFRNPTQAATLNLIAAVRELKTAYGAGFILSAAPETFYVQTGYSAYNGTAGAFLPVLYNIRDILNYVQVQLYNTGTMVALNNQVYGSGNADFIVSMTDMLLRGFPVAGTGQSFPALRPDQVAIGLPACTSAAGSGYAPPVEVLKALDYLTKGISYGGTYATTGTYPGLRGMMTWSVNWDKQGCGRPTYEFVNTYWDYFFGTPGTPSVTLTSPANNATFTAPAPIPLAASVANTSPTKVEFYSGSTKLGEDLTAPYEFTWTNVPVGSYSLTAKAVLSAGGPLTSSAVAVTVSAPANQLPSVSLTSPSAGASFTGPATVPLAATASDSDGSVAKVEFFNGGTKLGEDLTAPYEFAWTNVLPGSYSLTAKATDNAGAMSTSAAVAITVNPAGGGGADVLGPNCAALNDVKIFEVNATNLTNATSFSWWCTGSTQSVTPVAGQPWKASIAFGPSFSGGEVCVGVNYSVAPWYRQFCKTVTVCTGPPANQPPSVSLTSPANTATFTAPATISLAATASDADGSVAKVEFFQGTTKLGEDASAPYEFTWASVSAGNYTLSAKATDNAGAMTTSVPANVSVTNPAPPNQAPTVSLSSPTANATFTAPANVAIAANAGDTDGSVSKVEFFQGSTKLGEDLTAPYEFAWNGVAAGTYSLVAKATDNAGATTTSATVSITVNAPANQPPTVSLTSPTAGATFTAPATISLAANASDANGSVAKVEFFQGSTKLGEDLSAPYTFSWTNVVAGTYSLTAKATDNAGATTTSAAVSIIVNGGTPPPSGDILGPDCVNANAVVVFELSVANRANATSYSWWCNGSTSSITSPAGQPWKATYDFGPSFSGGQVCAGVNYSAAPWYKQFCKPVTRCTARLSAEGWEEVPLNTVFPNPTPDAFTFVADRPVRSLRVLDPLGREHLRAGALDAGQRLRFGERLEAGSYALRIEYTDQTGRTVKLMKTGR